MAFPGVSASDSIRGVYTLIVDADLGRRSLLTTILRYCGAYVQAADTVDNALRLIHQMRPDVLVAEFAGVGVGLISDLRALKSEHAGVPAIALGTGASEEAARSRGFDEFLVTPFLPWDLCRLVGRLAIP
jgi:CheY-like chemotaxis protein